MVDRTFLTIDEFEDFIALPENADRRFELIDGEIVEMSPSQLHGRVAGNLYRALFAYAEPSGLGRVDIEVRYRPANDRLNDRIPDVAFTSAARLLPVVERGPVPQMPDLAVEVKSHDDRYIEMRRKAAYYLENGVRLVWLVYPNKQVVEIHRLNGDSDILTARDSLDGEDVIPGFQMPLSSVFEE